MEEDSQQNTSDSPKLSSQTSPSPSSSAAPSAIVQENVNGTTYFYPTNNHTPSQSSSVGSDNTYSSQGHTNNYTNPGYAYPGPASYVLDMQPRTQLSSAFFMPDELRMEIQVKNKIANTILANESQDLPYEVDSYHSLFQLETTPLQVNLSVPSSTYKAIHVSTGIKYCLRRLHGYRLQSSKCMSIVEQWKKLQHSNIVQLKEVFTTKAFGDNSLVLVYDYHPGSETMYAKYFSHKIDVNSYSDSFSGDARLFSHKISTTQQRPTNRSLLPETELWPIIMQLTSGLRAIHLANLACRILDPTKIIITGKRLRFSFLGIPDVVLFESTQVPVTISNYQQEDLSSLGQLVMSLACRCLQATHRDNIQSSMEIVTKHYSSDLRNLILYLLTPSSRKVVTDLMPMIGARFYSQLEAIQSESDMLQDELSKEMENGRLYRILIKIGCINERPELHLDATWSETGDRYLLKLYRDYLFHSVTEDGRPWLDQAHMVQSLNKLDAGTLEKVQLMSRDEQSVLVVTYAELKECLEKAYSELSANALINN